MIAKELAFGQPKRKRNFKNAPPHDNKTNESNNKTLKISDRQVSTGVKELRNNYCW